MEQKPTFPSIMTSTLTLQICGINTPWMHGREGSEHPCLPRVHSPWLGRAWAEGASLLSTTHWPSGVLQERELIGGSV